MAMRSDLLLRGAGLLEADAGNPNGIQFDLSTWVKPSAITHPRDPYTFAEIPKAIPVNCDTTACAVGLFCLSGAFKEEGLDYEFHERGGGFFLMPTFTDKDGDKFDTFSAASQLFRITVADAEYLFDPDNYPDNELVGADAERGVAERIRNFVKGQIEDDHHPFYKEERASDDD